MEIENRETFLKVLSGEINLFLGAGFSLLATDADHTPLPDGAQLASELRNQFNITLPDLDLAKLCTVIAATDGRGLDAYLRKRFRVADFDPRYLALEHLHINSIFTMNIDDLIQRLYQQSTTSYVNDLSLTVLVFRDRRAHRFLICAPWLGLALRPPLYVLEHWMCCHRLRGGIPTAGVTYRPDCGRARLCSGATRFASHAGTLQAVAKACYRTECPHRTHGPWSAVPDSPANSGIVDYFRALNLQIIIADTADVLDFLAARVPRSTAALDVRSTDTRLMFPNEFVPLPTEVPSRPITGFFRGAAPIWSDIYSGALHRTAHYRTIREAIAGGRNATAHWPPRQRQDGPADATCGIHRFWWSSTHHQQPHNR